MDRFFLSFFLGSIGASVMILLILFLKKGLHRHISPRWQYNIDIFMVALLVLPMLPGRILDTWGLNGWLFQGRAVSPIVFEGMQAQNNAVQAVGGSDWMQEFSISVTRFVPEEYFAAFTALWVIGAVVFMAVLFFCGQKLKLVRESAKQVENEEFVNLFRQAKSELGIKKNVLFGVSMVVKLPMTVGVFKPLVILPFHVFDRFTEQEIRHILLHELAHVKRCDTFFNNLVCLFQAIYWFNPLVYLAFRKIRLDREIACDFTVLNRLSNENYISYGETIIHFVEKLPYVHPISLSMEMGGSKGQLTKRIEKIADYNPETMWQRIKSIGIFTIIGILVFSQAPPISALGANNDGWYHFRGASVRYENLSSYFSGHQGSFVLYDMEKEQYAIYNKNASQTRVSPVSTYKIYSALIALETDAIDIERSIREWDGATYPFETWNQDQDLMTAMQNSVSWYFQDIDAQVGIEGLGSYFTRLSYGNYDLSGGIADYWMESSLRISPLEQVNLLKSFYENDTIFKTEHVNALKDVLRLAEKDGAVLSGKTGTGSVNGKVVNGWFVGYVENSGRTFIFATNIQGKDDAGSSTAVQITLSILNDKGIYS